MLELTANTPVLEAEQIDALYAAFLADPAFLRGLLDGMNTYECTAADLGGMVTTLDLFRDLTRELNPRVLANEREYDAFRDWTTTPTPYAAGYLAGMVALHTTRFRGWQVPEIAPSGQEVAA
jgi:hypothetical protein